MTTTKKNKQDNLLEAIDQHLRRLETWGKKAEFGSEHYKHLGACHTMFNDVRKLIISDRERMINELNLRAFPDSDGIIYLSDAIATVTGKER